MENLNGKVAVVTGAASGIGRGLAERFAAEGTKVVLADIEESRLQAVRDELAASGAEVVAVRTDVSSESEVEALADQTIDAFGGVHVVCNNAGAETGAMFADIPVRVWNWTLGVKLYGAIHGCRAFLPLLREQGEGHIVNTGSTGSFDAAALTMAPYVTANFAILALTENLAAELRYTGDNIGVSVLAPGLVKADMFNSARNRPDDLRDDAIDPVHAQVLEGIRDATAQMGVEPAAVAALVVQAIHENRFFIFTDETGLQATRRHQEWIEGGPTPIPWSPEVRHQAR